MKKSIILLFLIFTFSMTNNVDAKNIKIATWNMEHLAEKNNAGCRPRKDEDYKKLKNYAESLNLDIVAVQEVENKIALQRVFPDNDWHIEMANQNLSEGGRCNNGRGNLTPQLVGFAIKRTISYERLSDVKLSDSEKLRVGVQIRLINPTGNIDILSVHLKSRCFDDNSKNVRDCDVLAKQIPKISSWIDSKAENKENFIILGDFNRRINVKTDSVWASLDDGIPNEYSDLERITEGLSGCLGYSQLIDHIVVNKQLKPRFTSTFVSLYRGEALSDHCPVISHFSLSDVAPRLENSSSNEFSGAPLRSTEGNIFSELSGLQLRNALKESYYKNKHKSLGYNKARTLMFGEIDVRNGDIIDVYAGMSKKSRPTTFLDPINTEHTIPQSWFSGREPMKSDLHHLFPTHEVVNGVRKNYPFSDIDDSGTEAWYHFSDNKLNMHTSIPTSNIDVYSEFKRGTFEPPEAHKGNVARAIAYFYTMYNMDNSRSIVKLVSGDISLLKKWHEQDPVDDAERNRNRLIEKYQGNLNPYIEDSSLLCRAWGC